MRKERIDIVCYKMINYPGGPNVYPGVPRTEKKFFFFNEKLFYF